MQFREVYIFGLLSDTVSPNPQILNSTGFIKQPVQENKRKRKIKAAYLFLLNLHKGFLLYVLRCIGYNTGIGIAGVVKTYWMESIILAKPE